MSDIHIKELGEDQWKWLNKYMRINLNRWRIIPIIKENGNLERLNHILLNTMEEDMLKGGKIQIFLLVFHNIPLRTFIFSLF